MNTKRLYLAGITLGMFAGIAMTVIVGSAFAIVGCVSVVAGIAFTLRREPND